MASLLATSHAWASPRAYEQLEDVSTKPYDSGPSAAPSPAQNGVPARPNAQWGAAFHGIDARRDGSNYIVLGLCNLDQRCKNDAAGDGRLLKYRLDIELDVVRIEHRPWVGYWYVTLPFRVIGFWDVFNSGEHVTSSPFVEHDYAPAVELSWAPAPELSPVFLRHRLLFRLGARHESNGLGVYPPNHSNVLQLSRSWDVVYLGSWYRRLLWPRGRVSAGLELWLPFADEDVFKWPNGETTRQHIADHYGYGLLRTALTHRFRPWAAFTLVLEARMHSLQTELRWRIGPERVERIHAGEAAHTLDSAQGDGRGLRPTSDNFFALDLVMHCVFGRGERLITANEERYACYAGVGF